MTRPVADVFEAIPSDEWDFRPVAENELRTALELEFVRSSSSLRGEIQAFHQSPVHKLPLSVFPAATKFLKILRNDASVGDLIELIGRSLFGFSPADAVEIRGRLRLFLPDKVRKASADEVAITFWDLSRPFIQWKRDFGALINNYLLGAVSSAPLIDSAPEAWMLAPTLGRYPNLRVKTFLVNWKYTNRALRDQFVQWLDQNRPQKAEIRAGRPTTAERLKQLSAFRLKSAQISYSQATKILLPSRPGPNVGGLEVFPNYSTQHAWDVAVKKADKLLRGNFIEEIRGEFGMVM